MTNLSKGRGVGQSLLAVRSEFDPFKLGVFAVDLQPCRLRIRHGPRKAG